MKDTVRNRARPTMLLSMSHLPDSPSLAGSAPDLLRPLGLQSAASMSGCCAQLLQQQLVDDRAPEHAERPPSMPPSSPERRAPAACTSPPAQALMTANCTRSPSGCWPAHPVSRLAAVFAFPRLAHVHPIAQVPRGGSPAASTAREKVRRRRQSLKLLPRPPFPARLLTACGRLFVLSGRCTCSRAAAEGAVGRGDVGGVGMARAAASAASSAAARRREARLRACPRVRCGIGPC